MTSEQVLWILMALVLGTGGCGMGQSKEAMPRIYPDRQLWAVVPLRNESGSLHADGTRLADHLADQFEIVPGIDTVPVNRVLAAMEAKQMFEVATPADALNLRHTLGVDGLIIGTINAYDPYDPPKLGIMIELYVDTRWPWFSEANSIRPLTWAAVDGQTRPHQGAFKANQPISVVSGYFDAADPTTRRWLRSYAQRRGVSRGDAHAEELYRINMDLYTEFVAYSVSRRMMQAELARLAPTRFAGEQPAY